MFAPDKSLWLTVTDFVKSDFVSRRKLVSVVCLSSCRSVCTSMLQKCFIIATSVKSSTGQTCSCKNGLNTCGEALTHFTCFTFWLNWLKNWLKKGNLVMRSSSEGIYRAVHHLTLYWPISEIWCHVTYLLCHFCLVSTCPSRNGQRGAATFHTCVNNKSLRCNGPPSKFRLRTIVWYNSLVAEDSLTGLVLCLGGVGKTTIPNWLYQYRSSGPFVFHLQAERDNACVGGIKEPLSREILLRFVSWVEVCFNAQLLICLPLLPWSKWKLWNSRNRKDLSKPLRLSGLFSGMGRRPTEAIQLGQHIEYEIRSTGSHLIFREELRDHHASKLKFVLGFFADKIFVQSCYLCHLGPLKDSESPRFALWSGFWTRNLRV